MKLFKIAALLIMPFAGLNAQTITGSIDYSTPTEISPLIFGFNQDHEDLYGIENWKSRRLGGNRLATFNWENNASNAGNDYLFSNDNRIPNLLGIPSTDKDKAGEAYKVFHQQNLDAGVTSIITVPIWGWVAADKEGENKTSPPSLKWDRVVFQKGSAFSLTPDLNDGVVYIDESINFLVQTFGDATTSTGVKYISLDNEPGLWYELNKNIQPNMINVVDYVDKVIGAALAVKSVDPNIKIIVGEFAGINIYDFKNPTDWATEKGSYDWFPSYFLDKLKQASNLHGVQLVDIIAYHNYPQSCIDVNGEFLGERAGGEVVRTTDKTDDYIRKARMDFPRSMWDNDFVEPSWLTVWKISGQPQKLFHRLKKSIDDYFPGVKIMIGEYDYGHDVDISHGIAVTELLASACAYNLEIITRWDLKLKNTGTYTSTAYQLFNNCDGADGSYGSDALQTNFDNKDKGSIWASFDEDDDDLHLILINKDLYDSTEFNIDLNNSSLSYLIKELYQLNSDGNTVQSVANNGTIDDDELTIKLPKLSATHLVIERSPITNVEQLVANNPFNYNRESRIISGLENGGFIFDTTGRLVIKSTNNEINVANLSTGIYILLAGSKNFKFEVK